MSDEARRPPMPDVSQIIADIEAWLDKAAEQKVTQNANDLPRVVSLSIAACSPDRIRALLDEVKRLRAVSDFNTHPNAPDPDGAVYRVMERKLADAEAELARLRAPVEGEVGEVVKRLSAPRYGEPLMQRWDLWRKAHAEGFDGTNTRDEFESIIYGIDEERQEAADLLQRLAGQLAEARAENERWRGLRDAIADLRGYGPEWPEHGNVPLAIAAGYSLTLTRATTAEARLQEAVDRINQLIAALASTAMGEQDGARRSAIAFLSTLKDQSNGNQ